MRVWVRVGARARVRVRARAGVRVREALLAVTPPNCTPPNCRTEAPP